MDDARNRSPQPGAPRSAELVRLLGTPGDVSMRIWPVADHDRLSRLIALLTRIDGVDGITVERFDARDALLIAHVSRPAATGGELAARLDRGIVDCGLRDGRVDVQIVARSTGAPIPPPAASDVPPGLRAHHIPNPLPAGAPGPAPSPPRPAGSPPRPAGADRPSSRPDPGGVVSAGELVEHALRSLLGVSMLVCDTDLRIRSVAGPAWPQPPGDRSEGRGVRDVLEQETWRALAPALVTALGGEAETVEFDGIVPDSRFVATCTPVIDDGAVIGATAVARDAAVERGDRLALGALNDEFEDVFQHSPVGQGLLSISGRWVRVNARLCELLGATPGELLGEDAGRWLHPDDRVREADRFRLLLAGRAGVEEMDFRVTGSQGHVSTVRAHVSVLRTPDGWPRGAIVQIAHLGA